MEPVQKCLLLPIDDTEESLRPVEFLARLYPRRENINLIVCYFLPPLAPIYREKPDTGTMVQKRLQMLREREEGARRAFERAKKMLVEAGFSETLMQEHAEERELTVAHQACRVADIRKVDAVVVQKRTTSSLEAFLKGEAISAMLKHCLVSPVWMLDGHFEPSEAAVCITNEETSLRAADHAAFMLAETDVRIDVLHVSKSAICPILSPGLDFSVELERWLMMPPGREMRHYIEKSCQIMASAGIQEQRCRVMVLPCRNNAAMDVLDYSRQYGIGILVLGHSAPDGTWGFLQSSFTEKILPQFRNMAVWVNQ